MRIIKVLLVLPLVIISFILFFYAIPLPGILPHPWTSERSLFVAVLTGLFAFGSLIWLFLYSYKGIWGQAKPLNDSLLNNGLILKQNSLFLRKYTGFTGNRKLEIILRPAYRLEPWRIEMSIESDYGIYFAMGNRKPLLLKENYKKLTLKDTFLKDVEVYVNNEVEFNQFVKENKKRGQLHYFIENIKIASGWEVYFDGVQARINLRVYKLFNEEIVVMLKAFCEISEKVIYEKS